MNGHGKIEKVEMLGKVYWDDGSVETRSLSEADLSSHTLDVTTRDGFRNSFGPLETDLVEMRNEAGLKATQIVLDSFAPVGTGAKKTKEVETELGRPNVVIAGDLAASVGPRERLYSPGIEQLLAHEVITSSYRDTPSKLNRALHRSNAGALQSKTISNWAKRTGEEAHAAYVEEAERVLAENGFDPNTGLPAVPYYQLSWFLTGPCWPQVDVASEQWLKAQTVIDRINAPGREPVNIDIRGLQVERHGVYMAVDEVCVDKQKGTRKKPTEVDRENGTYLWHTDIHIKYFEECNGQLEPQSWVFTSTDRSEALKVAVAFMIENNLLTRDLIFLLDGAKDLKAKVCDLFWFHPYRVILDWYHIKKKLGEYISGAMVNAKLRKKVYGELLHFLWAGDVSGARDYIKGLPESDIRNGDRLEKILGYLDRKEPDIACYAIRKALGLPNSSSPVEKANDVIVAQRQKRDGMSWTVTGTSAALAALRMLECNGQLDDWLATRAATLRAA